MVIEDLIKDWSIASPLPSCGCISINDFTSSGVFFKVPNSAHRPYEMWKKRPWAREIR